MRMSSLLLTAAVAGLMGGTLQLANAAVAGDTPVTTDAATPAEKHACKGMNSCKGKGGCKTETTDAGKNACKGHGGCATVKHECKGHNECKAMGGCKTAEHACAGMNECKGKGGCKLPKEAKDAKKS